jgi:O-succinylbenzoate synthase
MRIDAIDVYYVALPLIYPWRTAYGEDPEIHSVLVRLRSGDHEGWGEGTPFYAPTYSPECAASVFYLITELFVPQLIGREVGSAENLLEQLSMFKGNSFAKGAVESAWWNLEARLVGQPLHRLLGGETRDVDAGADFGVQDSYDMLLEKIEGAVDHGFQRVKLKARPGWDLEMLRLVRSTFPDLTMHIDCNAGYTLDDLPFFKAVDELDLAMIEQPLYYDDLVDHAELQKQIRTPVCLDESVKCVRHFETALRLGSCQVLNIKYGRVGGLSAAVKLHDLAQDAGIPCWVGGMLESAIGGSIGIELATLPNFTYPNDLFESQRFYRQDLTEPETHLNPDCTFSPSTVPGTPYEPVMERVEQVTRRQAHFEA